MQALIITSFLTQKHLNYHLKGTTSEKSAELYGEGNERQLCVGADYVIDHFETASVVTYLDAYKNMHQHLINKNPFYLHKIYSTLC